MMHSLTFSRHTVVFHRYHNLESLYVGTVINRGLVSVPNGILITRVSPLLEICLQQIKDSLAYQGLKKMIKNSKDLLY